MNAKISVFVICVELMIYLLLYNLHDCTFKAQDHNNFQNMHYAYFKLKIKVFTYCCGSTSAPEQIPLSRFPVIAKRCVVDEVDCDFQNIIKMKVQNLKSNFSTIMPKEKTYTGGTVLTASLITKESNFVIYNVVIFGNSLVNFNRKLNMK